MSPARTRPTLQAARTRPSRRAVIGAALVAAVVIAAGVIAIPRPPALSTEITGDAALAERVTELLDGQSGARDHLVVAVIEQGDGEAADSVTTAGFGADADTEFEIGSVSKTITAALFAQAIVLGEVGATDTVGDHLPMGDSPAADVTLEELVSHRSGLPSIDMRPGQLVGSLWAQLRGVDPYAAEPGAVVEAARAATLSDRGQVAYSNMGMALLGQVLASAASMPYEQLVAERVAGPFDLPATSVPTTADALADGAPTGYGPGGRPQGAWTLGSYAPAGGVRSTLTDMTTYAQVLLDGDTSAVEALEPRFDAGDGQRIGWAWFTTPVSTGDGGEVDVTWHNGMTGGFASMVALDRDGGRAVVVLSDTAVSVDDLAFDLLVGGAS